MAGTKPWRRTCWSSSASGHRRRLGGEARWRPDKALRRAAHPAMQVVRPPAAAGQSRRPSSSPWLASVKDTDYNNDRRVVTSSRCRRCCCWYSQLSLPQLPLPLSSRQPLLLPPTPPLQPSVDGWLLCCLLRCLPPNLSSTTFVIVQSSTLSPPAAVPYRRPLPAAVLSITFAAPVDGWLLRSPPTQLHTN